MRIEFFKKEIEDFGPRLVGRGYLPIIIIEESRCQGGFTGTRVSYARC